MAQKDKEGNLPACGLCLCGAHEVDQLVKLGDMGHICCCCLEMVSDTMLPLAAKLCSGNPPVARAHLADNVVLLAGRRPKD